MSDGMRVRVEASSFLLFFSSSLLSLLARVYLFGRPRLVFKWMLLHCPYGTIFPSLSSRSTLADEGRRKNASAVANCNLQSATILH